MTKVIGYRSLLIGVSALFLIVSFDHGAELPAQSQTGGNSAAAVQQMKDEAYDLNQTVIQLSGQGRFKEAIPKAKRALMLSKKIHGPKHRNVTADLFTLANLYIGTGDYFNAEPLIQEAISIDRELFGANHPEVAIDMGGLGLLYKKKGDYTSAEQSFTQAAQMMQASLKDHGNAKYLMNFARLLHNLANLQLDMQKYQPALESYFNAEQIYEIYDKKSAVEVLVTMAEIKRKMGDHGAANAYLNRAETLAE